MEPKVFKISLNMNTFGFALFTKSYK